MQPRPRPSGLTLVYRLKLACSPKLMTPVGRIVRDPSPSARSNTLVLPLSVSDQGSEPNASVYRNEPLIVTAFVPPTGSAVTPTSPRSLNGGGYRQSPTPTRV